MNESHDATPNRACCDQKTVNCKNSWYRNPVFIALLGTALIWVSGDIFPSVKPFSAAYFDYLNKIWWAILLGFIFGGAIDYYIPRAYISKYLASTRKRTILSAVGLGFLMSACSHGIIALTMELHKKGASGPAAVSFLLASPWANFPMTLMLIGFFGWKGFVIIISALVVAIITGFVFQILDRKNMIEKNKNTVDVGPDFSVREDIAKRLKNYRFSMKSFIEDMKGVLRGGYELSEMVLGWLFLGMLFASAASVFVPQHIFHHYFGPSVLGLLMTIAAATVIEVCSEGTSPLAFEIYKQSGAFGNAFVFLMGGVITDYTEIALV